MASSIKVSSLVRSISIEACATRLRLSFTPGSHEPESGLPNGYWRHEAESSYPKNRARCPMLLIGQTPKRPHTWSANSKGLIPPSRISEPRTASRASRNADVFSLSRMARIFPDQRERRACPLPYGARADASYRRLTWGKELVVVAEADDKGSLHQARVLVARASSV